MKYIVFILVILSIIALGMKWYASTQDDKVNRVLLEKPFTVEEKYQKEYDELAFVADLHSDALLWQRNLTQKHDRGQVDIPRLREGNVALQAFTIVTKSPKGQNAIKNDDDSDRLTLLSIAQWQPPSTWFSLYGRAAYQCKKLASAAKRDDKFRMIRSKSDLKRFIKDRAKDRELVAGYLGIEGGHCLEGDISNVQKLYDLGVRMMAATHFFDNKLGGSAHGEEQGGLTAFGKEVIKEMDRLGMIIDVAHISPRMFDHIAAITSGVMMDSHTGVRAICDSPRNLSDHQIRTIAEKGGVIGVGYFSLAICEAKIPRIVETMTYIKNLVGIEYVALGSDFDGAVATPIDATGLNLLYKALRESGYTIDEIELIMGENVKRMLLQHLPE